MTQITFDDRKNLEQTCQKILRYPEIRFCGVINRFGHLVAGGFKNGIKPLESDEKRRMSYMQMILDINMRKEHDDTLGQLNILLLKGARLL